MTIATLCPLVQTVLMIALGDRRRVFTVGELAQKCSVSLADMVDAVKELRALGLVDVTSTGAWSDRLVMPIEGAR